MVLEPVEHHPTVEDRQGEVEDDRVRLVLVGERQAGIASQPDDALEAALARDVEHRAGEVGIVVDDQHGPVAGLDLVAVVLDLAWQEQGRIEVARQVAVRQLGADLQRLGPRRCCGRVPELDGVRLGRPVDDRQVEGEGAAIALL